MKKLRVEVLVETYVEYRGSTYVRGMEYTVDEKDDSIEWHKVGEDNNWYIVKNKKLNKELEDMYLKTFVCV